MNANKLNEKLEKVQSSAMKSANSINEITIEGAKKINQVHNSLANHVAKNIQLATINLMTAKSPRDILGAVRGDGGTPFIEGLQHYQQSLKDTFDHCIDDYLEANDEIYNHSKGVVNEFFNIACQNAPDGMDALIKPYQSAVNISLEGVDQIHALARNYMHNLENSFAGGGIFGKISDFVPETSQRKYSKRSQSVEKAL